MNTKMTNQRKYFSVNLQEMLSYKGTLINNYKVQVYLFRLFLFLKIVLATNEFASFIRNCLVGRKFMALNVKKKSFLKRLLEGY